MASTSKRTKISANSHQQPLSVDDLSDYEVDLLSAALHKLCSARAVDNIKLIPCKLNSCNAGLINGAGIRFSEAFCDLQSFDKGFFMGNIFRKGLDIGVDFLDGKIPESKQEKMLLEKLVNFIKSEEMVEVEFENKVDRTVYLANHLFGKLALSWWYTIDKSSKIRQRGSKCSCSNKSCTLTGKYGDTSIGNPQVWHGSVDLIIGSDIVIENLEEEPVYPDGLSVKAQNDAITRNSKLVAETIVMSFLQKKNHPEMSSFLIPCLGIGENVLLIMFYDSEHDVFLESSVIPLFSELRKNRFSMEAILVSWLAVNYKFLSTGLTNDMLSYTAGFCKQAKSSIAIYENQLTFQNVGLAEVVDIDLPQEWDYNAYLLEKNDKIDEMNRKRRFKDCKN
ncbi:uncharacterized protein LOC134247965 [Saccostrea cucullata]|uniref:uncharacterized protein LOC134247965 n=1 Tax=Saccostrea cuccullata TaxID=36930 RepID=UPI002ED5DC06